MEQKQCPVCTLKHTENVCPQCGWDYPVMLGREEDVGVALNKRLFAACEAWHACQGKVRSSAQDAESAAWELATRQNTAASYKAYLANPEYGFYRAKALRCLADVEAHDQQAINQAAMNKMTSPAWQTNPNGQNLQVAAFFQALFKGGATLGRWLRRTLPLLNPVWLALGRFLHWLVIGCWHLVQKLFNGIERQLSSSFASPLVTLMFWAAGLVFAFVIFVVSGSLFFSKLGETLGLLASAACAIIFYALWVNNPWLTRYRFWTAAIAGILLYMLFKHFGV